MRTFESGATRDSDDGKIDYEAILSPLVIQRFGEYMLQHSTLPDGSKRSGDNWQHGFGLDVTLKSLWRHHVDVWSLHRSAQQHTIEMEEALCAVLFNAAAYLHQLLADDPIDAGIAKDAAFYRRVIEEGWQPFPSMPPYHSPTSVPEPDASDYEAWEASQPDVYMDRCAGEHQRAFEQALLVNRRVAKERLAWAIKKLEEPVAITVPDADVEWNQIEGASGNWKITLRSQGVGNA